MKLHLFVLFFCLAATAQANWPFPTAPGTQWRYTLNRDGKPSATLSLTVVSAGTDALAIDPTLDGVHQPPVEVKVADLLPRAGNFAGKIGGLDAAVDQVDAGEEEVEVTAGKFRAQHFHGERFRGRRTVTDRWFVPDVGWVKETATQRSPTGQLLARASLELLAVPKPIGTAPESVAPEVEASVSTSSAGDPLSVIPDDALQIVTRWRVQHVAPKTQLRAIWIAEATGEVAPGNFKVDEAASEIPGKDGVGALTLSRPPDGWATGHYRVELYLNDKLAKSIPLTIAASPRTTSN